MAQGPVGALGAGAACATGAGAASFDPPNIALVAAPTAWWATAEPTPKAIPGTYGGSSKNYVGGLIFNYR